MTDDRPQRSVSPREKLAGPRISAFRMLGLSMASFTAGFFATVVCAYVQSGGVPFDHQKPIFETRNTLWMLNHHLSSYVQSQGTSPDSLNELAQHLNATAGTSIHSDAWVDSWGWMIQYRKTGASSYQLYSWGRDGGMGGAGIDAEFKVPTPNYGRVSLMAYCFRHINPKLLLGAIVTGVALVIIALSSDYGMIRVSGFNSAKLRTVIDMLLIFLAAVLMGFFMAFHYAVDLSIGGH